MQKEYAIAVCLTKTQAEWAFTEARRHPNQH